MSTKAWGMQLASDASSDNSELYVIVERMFEIIRHIEAHFHKHGQRTREVVGASNDMRQSIRALHSSSSRLRSTASNLHHLTSAFQVSG